MSTLVVNWLPSQLNAQLIGQIAVQARLKNMKRAIDIYIAVVASALLLSSAIIYLAPQVGWRFSNIVSGSMSPTMEAGTLVVSHAIDPASLKVGDAIVFRSVDNPRNEVCHRIVDIPTTLPLTYKTKGDAYPSPDPWTLPAANVVGKVEYSFPLAGYYVSFLKTNIGLFLGLIVPALILLLVFFRSIWRELIKIIRAQVKNEKV